MSEILGVIGLVWINILTFQAYRNDTIGATVAIIAMVVVNVLIFALGFWLAETKAEAKYKPKIAELLALLAMASQVMGFELSNKKEEEVQNEER